MTANERKILTLISRYGPLTKRELCARASISWATAVKMVSRLVSSGFLEFAGLSERKNVQGKDSALYDLSEEHPLAIGMDIEYSTTHLLLTNLKDRLLHTHVCPTPALRDLGDLGQFVVDTIDGFLAATRFDQRRDSITGAGIVLPAFLIQVTSGIFSRLQEDLSGRVPFPVIVDDVVRAYTLNKERRLFSSESFLMVTVRSGIGLGISIGGQILRGEDNLAGELSHVTIDPQGEVCPRCGKRGCFETYINENVLLEKSATVLNQIASDSQSPDGNPESPQALSLLFSAAKAGNPSASRIVRQAAEWLARGLALPLLILNIPRIYLGGHFGPDGDVIVPMIHESLQKYLPRSMLSCRISYEPLDDQGFTFGASLLILKQYCEYGIS